MVEVFLKLKKIVNLLFCPIAAKSEIKLKIDSFTSEYIHIKPTL